MQAKVSILYGVTISDVSKPRLVSKITSSSSINIFKYVHFSDVNDCIQALNSVLGIAGVLSRGLLSVGCFAGDILYENSVLNSYLDS